MIKKYRLGKAFDIIFCLLILAFSFYLPFESGQRGFFAFDQSIYFDGSYRILIGQIPYKDFVIPFGPMVFWIQAVFFKLFGINYSSYISSAAITNVLAVACSILILRILFPFRRFLSYISGLVTAAWFYSPFGTIYVEQTAFFFSLLAITAILVTLHAKDRYPAAHGFLLSASGIFTFLSCISKQNAGPPFFLLCILLLIAISMPKIKNIGWNMTIYSAGFIGSMALFFIWLTCYSNLEIFVRYFFQIPSNLIGVRLLEHGWLGLFKNLFFMHRMPTFFKLGGLVIIFTALSALLPWFCGPDKYKDEQKRLLLSCTICIFLVIFQNYFTYGTNNQLENGLSFTGIILAINTGLLFHLLRHIPMMTQNIAAKNISKGVVAAAIFISSYSAAFMLIAGTDVSLHRVVQDIFNGSTFTKCFSEQKLKSLKWGYPTEIRGSTVTGKDITDLLGYLKSENKNIFIFPDFTIFYALLGVPSPQPVLWFHKGLTYPVQYDEMLDNWIVRDLIKNKVEIVIIEKSSFIGTDFRLNDFPVLKSYIENNFRETGQIGIFKIYK